jgi:sulfate permease, SulP family
MTPLVSKDDRSGRDDPAPSLGQSLVARLKLFLNPFDARYEDMRGSGWYLVVLRDFSAGLIVAMMAIPLAMGFAMASGLKPEQGIVGGAIAGLVGALFGGSKYQVYGPTAAFIPVIAGLMTTYTPLYGFDAAHGMLVLASLLAGLVLVLLGLSGLGKVANLVPHSIVVGFTIGIAVTIALSQVGEVLGLHAGFQLTDKAIAALRTDDVPPTVLDKLGVLEDREFATRTQFLDEMSNVLEPDELAGCREKALKVAELRMPPHFVEKVRVIGAHLGEFEGNALLLAMITFLVTQYLLKVSKYIPAPLIAIAVGIVLSWGLADGHEISLVKTKYGAIPTDFTRITPPVLPAWDLGVLQAIAYFAAAIVFVSGVESLLCSRMADRLADNRGTPYNPNKEFWGQGLVQIFVPLFNGFPHTGALARTATNIKVGAVTPLAGIFKCCLKLALAYYLASFLELVPMACIGGILMWVAFNMVKPAEITQVFAHNWFHVALMMFTAVTVIVTDFLTGVLSAIILYGLLFKFLDKPRPPRLDTTVPAHDTEDSDVAIVNRGRPAHVG